VVRELVAGGGFFTPIGRQVPSSRYTSPRACASLRKSLTEMTILSALSVLPSADLDTVLKYYARSTAPGSGSLA
jgi:hypothetical protein